jgi:hypothetical protein
MIAAPLEKGEDPSPDTEGNPGGSRRFRARGPADPFSAAWICGAHPNFKIEEHWA